MILTGVPSLRPIGEINRAHKILEQIHAGKLPNPFAASLERERLSLKVALEVLGWVLEDDHARGFQALLSGVEIRLMQAGCELPEVG